MVGIHSLVRANQPAAPARHRRLAVGLAALACLVSCWPRPAHPDVMQEYEVKAAFLYNFAKFVAWPNSAFDAADDKLVMCILGSDPFGPLLDDVVGSRTVQERPLVVWRIENEDDVRFCHVLYIGASEHGRLGNILQRVRAAHVLTVSEADDFMLRGGMINFVMFGSKVRFEINAEAARRSGLQISSQLLKLAANVIPDRADAH